MFFFSSRRRHTRSLRDWSSDVCSSDLHGLRGLRRGAGEVFLLQYDIRTLVVLEGFHDVLPGHLLAGFLVDALVAEDRKSTRLNSSHVEISYAVFCLKKKKKKYKIRINR